MLYEFYYCFHSNTHLSLMHMYRAMLRVVVISTYVSTYLLFLQNGFKMLTYFLVVQVASWIWIKSHEFTLFCTIVWCTNISEEGLSVTAVFLGWEWSISSNDTCKIIPAFWVHGICNWICLNMLEYSWIAHQLQVGNSLGRRHNLVWFQIWDQF